MSTQSEASVQWNSIATSTSPGLLESVILPLSPVCSQTPDALRSPFLSPASVSERSAIFSAICTSALPPPPPSPQVPFSGIRYAEFLRFSLLLKRNRSDEAQRFLVAFPALSTFKIGKSVLLSSIEAYLVARRDQKYETPTEGGRRLAGKVIRTSPEAKISEADVGNGVRRFSETEGGTGDVSWMNKGRDQRSLPHEECCMCGCKAGRLG
jgi:hypothetical protein